MGRSKKKTEETPKGAKPKGSKTVGFRATYEWADWLERLARHSRTDVAKVIDAALTEYAKAHGFKEPPPERMP
jgi:hypothetical protein